MPATRTIRIADSRPFTAWEGVRQTFLRWYVLLPVVLLGSAAAFLLKGRVQPSYKSEATVRLVAATVRPQLETGVTLPREELPDPETLGNSLQEMVLVPEAMTKLLQSSPAFAQDFERQGEKLLLWLRARARVMSKSAEVFVVEAWARTPEQAREMVHWMALGTMDAYKRTLRDRAETLAKFTKQQADLASKELTEHEEKMVSFLRANPGLLVTAMDRDRRLTTTGPDRMRVQSMLARAGSALTAKDPGLRALMEERERLQADLRSFKRTDVAASAGGAKLQELQAARKRLEDLRSQGLSDADPAVKLAQQQVGRIQSELQQVKPGEGGSSQLEVRTRARLKEIDTKIRSGLRQPQSTPRLEAQWGDLLRQQNLQLKRFEGFNRLANLAAFDNGLGVFENKALATLVTDASEPLAPKGIRPWMVLAVGVLLSCLLGLALALAVGRLDRTIHSVAELKQLVDLPVLAHLERQRAAQVAGSPDDEHTHTDSLIAWSKKEEVVEVGLKLSGAEAAQAMDQIADGGHLGRLALPPHQETALAPIGSSMVLGELLDDFSSNMRFQSVVAQPPEAPGVFLATAPHSSGADQVRLLASRLVDGEAGARVVLVAGWELRSGRTTVAANIAMALAEARRKVLLVDSCGGDGSLTRLMGLRPDPAASLYEQLSARMSGATASWTVYRLAESLSMVPASSQNPTMGPMLSSVAFGDFIDHCRSVFDVVVLDSRALSEVSDVVILQRKADAVVVVVRRRATTLRGLQQLAQQLEAVRLTGTVFCMH
jgi:Mrp family chromosome partitioning ATPase